MFDTEKQNTKSISNNKETTLPTPKRLGITKGKFNVPENFDEMNKEIEEMFENHLQ